MGGNYEKTVAPVGGAKLRIHYDDKKGEVHVHDDMAKVKFVWPAFSWPATYAKLRADALKSSMGLVIDENRIELHATLSGRQVTFGLRSLVTGLEEFDKFVTELVGDSGPAPSVQDNPEKK